MEREWSRGLRRTQVRGGDHSSAAAEEEKKEKEEEGHSVTKLCEGETALLVSLPGLAPDPLFASLTQISHVCDCYILLHNCQL